MSHRLACEDEQGEDEQGVESEEEDDQGEEVEILSKKLICDSLGLAWFFLKDESESDDGEGGE